jgi:hypothetical protein
MLPTVVNFSRTRRSTRLSHSPLTIAFASPQATEWQHIGNQLDTAMIFARAGLRKGAYHFLRSFLTTHRSNTQISHNAIRNPTIGSSNPMNFQKDLAPPGVYDGTYAIVKSTLIQPLSGLAGLGDHGKPTVSQLQSRCSQAAKYAP